MSFERRRRKIRWMPVILALSLVIVVIGFRERTTRDVTSFETDDLGIVVPEDRPGAEIVAVAGLGERVVHKLARREPSPEEWQRLFPIHVGAQGDEMPPVMGHYSVGGDRVLFEPRFPFVRGLAYHARFDVEFFETLVDADRSDPATPAIETTFVLPEPQGEPTTHVSHVYPSANRLPANQLKFYIHFSAPMQRGGVYDHIRLVDGDGNDVAEPFLEMEPELWDPESRRLTLFFHPGRIKRGLAYHEEAGPALESGRTYNLIVDATLTDANGAGLAARYEKPFTVADADRTSPDPQLWSVRPPAVGSTESVRVVFREPIDHALLTRFLTVRRDDGGAVDGTVVIAKQETVWEYVPIAPWAAGEYVVVVKPELEDLAGNQIGRLFDVDTRQDQAPPAEREHVYVPFVVSAREGS